MVGIFQDGAMFGDLLLESQCYEFRSDIVLPILLHLLLELILMAFGSGRFQS